MNLEQEIERTADSFDGTCLAIIEAVTDVRRMDVQNPAEGDDIVNGLRLRQHQVGLLFDLASRAREIGVRLEGAE